MENNIDIPPFYLGEEVECITTHRQGIVKKGEKYIVTSVKKSCCCWIITIGIPSTTEMSYCRECHTSVRQGSEWELNSNIFRSINQKFETITYKAVLEQTQPMICVN